MRYRLRTLLITCLPLLAGWVQAPANEVAIAQVSSPVAVGVLDAATEPTTALEWTDLAFAIKDRAHFDVAQLPDRVRALEGKRVRLRGYFYLGTARQEVQEFLLLGEIDTRPTVAKFGAAPDELPIHQLAAVEMTAGKTAKFTQQPVAITGRLTFSMVRLDGRACLVFRIIADSVEPVQRRSGYGPALVGGC